MTSSQGLGLLLGTEGKSSESEEGHFKVKLWFEIGLSVVRFGHISACNLISGNGKHNWAVKEEEEYSRKTKKSKHGLAKRGKERKDWNNEVIGRMMDMKKEKKKPKQEENE